MSAERHFKVNYHSPSDVNIRKLTSLVCFSFVGSSLFQTLVENDIDYGLNSQHSLLFSKAVTASYLELRLKSATRVYTSNMQLQLNQSRQTSNKLILLQGLQSIL